MSLVTDNKINQLQELKDHLIKRKCPQKIIDYSFTKLFKPRKRESNDKNNVITFTRTYNHNYLFYFNKFENCFLKTLQIENFKNHLMKKKVLPTTPQPKKLKNVLVRAKFENTTIAKSTKLT